MESACLDILDGPVTLSRSTRDLGFHRRNLKLIEQPHQGIVENANTGCFGELSLTLQASIFRSVVACHRLDKVILQVIRIQADDGLCSLLQGTIA